MNRRDFLARCAALGASMPVFSFLQACNGGGGKYDNFTVNFTGKVVIIGAGAAGLAAGYILDRYGIDFEIIEANDTYGGRVQRNDTLAEFPIDIGAEWIHGTPGMLAELVDDSDAQGSIETIKYNPQEVYSYEDGELYPALFGGEFYSEYKFKRTTWFGFLETYIAAGITDRIRTGRPVTQIDYSGDEIVITDAHGQQYTADRVLITVPTVVLQKQMIDFVPALPAAKTQAIDEVHMPGGLKVSIKFSERFYPDYITMGGDDGDRDYLDAAFRKDSPDHVLTMFCAGGPAERYADMSDEEIFADVMAELDEMFDGKASETYEAHLVKHWTAEPYIGGAYTFWRENGLSTVNALLKPVEKKLYFAGEAYNYLYGSTVHGAMESAYEVVEVLLGD